MERLEKYLCVAVAALLLMSGGYVLGRRSPRVQAQAETAVPDTLRIRDTVFKDRPVPVEVRVTDTMLVAAVDPVQVMVRDTVQVMVIEVYPQTTIVTRTIFADSRKRWGIGVQAGYGAYFDGGDVSLSPYVGIGISWNILTW